MSASDVWAVGWSYGPLLTLVEHWDGRTWAVIPSPSPNSNAELVGVAASLDGNLWAVGSFGTPPTGDPARTLVERYCQA